MFIFCLHYLSQCPCTRDELFFFQAEDGIRVLVRSRGLGDVYKRQVEPRYSPDGKRIAWVSSRDAGRFTIWIADYTAKGLLAPRRLLQENRTTLARYYYSEYDHAINPGWSPDGKRLYFVSNRDAAWGSGDIWSVALDAPDNWQHVLREETTWSTRPEISPDGHRLLYSSYQGRQWHQLWLTTPTGDYPFPLTFGEFDRRNARWSADGEQVLYISNEGGNTCLLYTSDAADERSSVDLGGRRIIKKKKKKRH
mgnify:CR=1 FL=1